MILNSITLNDETITWGARVLVVVTTCSRPHFIQANLENLAGFVNEITDADIAVAIDGLSMQGNQQTLDYCLSKGVTCIFSEVSEGVGVSKNRVVALLGGYEYYFFIEDDVEVLTSRLFTGHLNLFAETDIHHFSLHPRDRLLDLVGSTWTAEGDVLHAMYGSAQVNFFTREALLRAGGWHPVFARLRRGGHTEHSYRVFRAKLCPAPFNLSLKLLETCRWNEPPHVVDPEDTGYQLGENYLFKIENELIEKELTFVPYSADSTGQRISP